MVATLRNSLLTAALVAAAVVPLQAQSLSTGQRHQRIERIQGMTSGEMVMPTGDSKAFRQIRPAVAALQMMLADLRLFEGRVNGLYGPSTREAIAAYQRQTALEVTGLPTLESSLALLGLERQLAERYAARIDLASRKAMPMAAERHGEMAEHEAPRRPPRWTTVRGDPQPVKSLMLMDMGAMAAKGEHALAARGVRALVGAIQIKLAEEGMYEGPIDGLPDEAGVHRALRAYQEARQLEESGRLDLPTALVLFGMSPEPGTEHGGGIDLADSPVAQDRALMEASLTRFKTDSHRRR